MKYRIKPIGPDVAIIQRRFLLIFWRDSYLGVLDADRAREYLAWLSEEWDS